MLSIKNLNLKSFVLGDIFEIKSLKSIDKNKLRNETGNIPYVTQTALNKGITKYVCDHGIEKLNSGNCISVGVDTQTVFYQEKDFYACEKMVCLCRTEFNKYNTCFIIPILVQILKQKFSYGYKSSLTRISKLEIPLPVTSAGKLDWDMMETYIKDRIACVKQQENEELKKKIEELETRVLPKPNIPRPTIAGKATADFPLGQVFPTITRGIQISKRNRKPGTLPYISASLLNHGEADFVSVDEKYIYKDCLTVPFIGGENCTFYHDGEFVPSSDVAVLQNENFDKHIYVFLIGILNVIMQKYSFGYKASLERLQKQTIPLPIIPDGKPDWEFMSDYIKTQFQIVFEEELKRLKSKLDEWY